jgi:hypothetical protein
VYTVGYEAYHHSQFLQIGLHGTGCKCKLTNFNQHNLTIYTSIRILLWPHIVLYPLSVKQNSVACPHVPLLILGVPWVKSLRNTE